MLNFNHSPGYIWPNPAFPFREYFSHPNLRVFIIENVQHNWVWLRDHSRRFQARDHFFVYCGWYFDEWFLKQDLQVFDALGLDKDKFFFLFNSKDEKDRYVAAGFNGELVNHNCWLDWNGAMKPDLSAQKNYDAVYVARARPFKRHFLAEGIPNLALVVGNIMVGESVEVLPKCSYLNSAPLDQMGVASVINSSKCGLILSEIEGACFASSEYLLCGVPVVSTLSHGGRDLWYDDYNAIVVSPNNKEIIEAVQFFSRNLPDPKKIRSKHIEMSQFQRELFISQLQRLFDENLVEQQAKTFFEKSYMHKLRDSETPNFKTIWP